MATELAPQKTGLFPGLSRSEYESIRAINFSSLKHFRRSAAHFRAAMISPPAETVAKTFGHCLHLAVFEPEKFRSEVVRGLQGVDKRTKAGKAQWAEFEMLHVMQEVLMPDEFDAVSEMQAAMMNHDTARELLTCKGYNEIAAVWIDEDTGELCKGRIDRISSLYSQSFVLDLKSTRDAADWAFKRDVMTYSYHEQAAFYLDGLAAIAPAERRFLHICQEKDPPYCVCVYELDEGALSVGRKAYREHLAKYKECRESGNYPGYLNGIHPLSLPKWAQQEEF